MIGLILVIVACVVCGVFISIPVIRWKRELDLAFQIRGRRFENF